MFQCINVVILALSSCDLQSNKWNTKVRILLSICVMIRRRVSSKSTEIAHHIQSIELICGNQLTNTRRSLMTTNKCHVVMNASKLMKKTSQTHHFSRISRLAMHFRLKYDIISNNITTGWKNNWKIFLSK